MKLLIIEDDITLAKTLSRRLDKNGFSCCHVNKVEEALLACHQHRPEAIILDMKLHNESGLTLISPMRALLPKTRIILLTGYASISTAVDAIKLGADEYLSKPVDTKTLLAALKNCNVSEIVKNSNINEVGNDGDPQETLTSEQVEWQHIQQVLKFNDGNISATARQLSMHRRTLQRKLQKRPSPLKTIVI